MAENLVFISGASSGLGAALARSVPFGDARVVDISRRGAEGCVHFSADLADPSQWPRVGDLFAREVKDFSGGRIVFVHAAGTLQPMGFSGEVPADEYAREVLLNSAAPQVLGDLFLRAITDTSASCQILMISSGAAKSVYEGWSAYGPGKAALDHWVRYAGLEQQRRGGCRVIAVAPGIVATAMQEQIRSMPVEEFPEVEKFIGFHRDGDLSDPDEVAQEIWALLDRDLPNGTVLDLRELIDARP